MLCGAGGDDTVKEAFRHEDKGPFMLTGAYLHGIRSVSVVPSVRLVADRLVKEPVGVVEGKV